MQVSENEWISKRAYTLWEKEGHPTAAMRNIGNRQNMNFHF